DRHGPRGRSRAAALTADRRAAQDAAPGRRRAPDPRRHDRQPEAGRHRGRRRGHRLRRRRGQSAGAGPRASPRRARRARLQRPGRDLEQRVLALVRARGVRRRCRAGQRRPRPPRRRGGANARRPRSGGAARARPREDARRGGDEGPAEPGRPARADRQAARSALGPRRVHRSHGDRAGRRHADGRGARGDMAAGPVAVLRGRLSRVRRARWRGGHRLDRRCRVGGGRRPRRPRSRAGDRMPVL
ncbi:MAG: putative nucleotide sugar-1-phosphate transferase, partial [uncultured Solirubrobacterales bacterium]